MFVPLIPASPGPGSYPAPAIVSFRNLLTSATTFSINKDSGSDTLNDGSSGAPWKTTTGAMQNLAKYFDTGGQTVTLQGVAAHNAFVLPLVVSAWNGGGDVIIDLNGGSITATSADVIKNSVTLPGKLTIQNGSLSNSGSGFFNCISQVGIGTIYIGASLSFGACLLFHMVASGSGANIFVPVSYTITGDALSHLATFNSGTLVQATSTDSISGPMINITGARTFSRAFAEANSSSNLTIRPFNNGTANVSPYQLTGGGAPTVTGKRYFAGTNANISTLIGSANFFPGTIAGTTDGTGTYA